MEVIRLRQGDITGSMSGEDDAIAFLGVPFAAPPIGDLRWRSPQPLSAGGAPLLANRRGPVCPQYPAPSDSVLPLGNEAQDEDCLYLNIWSPAARTDGLAPVVMWLHLGAFQLGSGSAPLYDGANWAKAGVVLVAPNYRLNKFGFLAHPALSAEQGGRSGNYGLLDQIAALIWIKDNIAAFGGDPDCVTVAGVSAGASSVSLLMGAPAARGLFHRAMVESGGSFGAVLPRTSCGDAWQDGASAEASGKAWADRLGATDVASLRALSVADVKSASAPDWSDNQGVFDAAQPIVDGTIVTEASYSLFSAGQQAPVPLLIGSAANEDLQLPHSPSLEAYERDVVRDHGDRAAEFRTLYPASTDAEAVAATLKANSHRLFSWQNWTMAKLHAAAGNETYYYRFQMVPPVPADSHPEQGLPRPLGAFHGASMFYTFQNFHLRNWPWTPGDYALSRAMIDAWAAFARTGRPESDGLPDWPRFDPERQRVMLLDAAPVSGPIPDELFLGFWDRFNAARDGRAVASP